ncbi:MAG: TAT-variant-translocated molybdopterin oxidoreductase, partial [Hyphomicrobium sp.]
MSDKKLNKFNLQEVRETLANKGGQEYWRSMDQVAQTPEFEAWVEDEFPNRSSILQIDRRDFIKFMGASMMLAGMAGCRSMFLPTEKIVPYVNKPEDIIPGKALRFATVFTHNQSALGVLVTSYEGRPVKIEGNPSHPNSMGATDHFAQATILDLYDPDRSREVFKKNLPSSWDVLLREARGAMDATDKGKGIFILTESVLSPTLAAELSGLQKAFPAAAVVQYDAVNQDNVLEGSNIARGARLHPRYDLGGVDVIASFDGDFIQSMPENVRMSREFSDKRKTVEMNRLYVVESSPSLTGAMADHRRAVKPSQIEANLRALAQRLGVAGIESGAAKVDARFIAAMASDLGSAAKKVVIVGASASVASHAIAHAINEALSGSVTYHAPVVRQDASQIDALRGLTKAINAGQVGVLVVLGGHPTFD